MLIETIRQYIADKNINIPADAWARMKREYDKNDIINALAKIIADGEIQMPLKTITLEEAISAEKELAKLETSIKQGQFYTRYEVDNLSDYYFDESAQFNVASNYFHQYSRFLCDSINSPSPYRIFHDEKFARSMCGALFSLKCEQVDTASLLSCLSLRKYIASQFKPSVAKAVYDFFKAEHVVDLCAGWGDRLAGFYASKYGKTYFGVDANSNLQDGYTKQIQEYSKLFPDKSAQVIYGATEDDNIVLPSCDLVFTSPPYFGIERYSKDDTQSYNRYRKLDGWLNGFLFPIVKKAADALVDGGHLVINVSDVYMNHQINRICHPMIEYAESIGLRLTNVYGMKMSKRINSMSVKDKLGVFCEPIYVFEK